MSLTTAGLTNSGSGNGVTAHYAVSYDSSLPNGAELTNGLLAGCESDFAIMQGWFGGINIPFSYPLGVQINNASGGANWTAPSPFQMGFGSGSYVSINPGANPTVALLRYLLVSEVTEMFMMSLDNGWFYDHGPFEGGDEGSKGEGLSRFLGVQLLIAQNLGTVAPSGYTVAPLWFNPQPASVSPGTPRADYVDSNPDDHQPNPITGCTTLFLYFLYSQLAYGIDEIIQKGSSSLAGVYQNLTGAPAADAWTAFNTIVTRYYPPGPTYNMDGDNVFPVSNLESFSAPDKITCGYSQTAEITLNSTAKADVYVGLSVTAGDPALVSFPASVLIPVGSTSASPTIQTTPQSLPFNSSPVTISATYAGTTMSAVVTVVSPRATAVTVSPATVICGNPVKVTVSLDRPSLKGSAIVQMSSSNTAFPIDASDPTLPIAQGTISADFTLDTNNYSAGFAPLPVTVSATFGGATVTAVVTIVSPTVASLELSPNTVPAGGSCSGVITLDRVSKDGDVVVVLNWQPPTFAATPGPVTIPVNTLSSLPFPVAAPVAIPPFSTTPFQGFLYATYAGVNAMATLTVTPPAGTGVLAALSISPTIVVGGTSCAGLVTLVAPVGSPTVVGLATSPTVKTEPGSNTPLPKAAVQSSVTVLPNQPSAGFAVTTEPLPANAASHTVGVVASAGGVTKSEIITFT